MGAKESTGRNEAGSEAPDATAGPDYYQLLEVDENATADEIKVSLSNLSGNQTHNLPCYKRSFRRLALIHHPDKNKDDVDGATHRFAGLQQAYEVSHARLR